MMTRGPHLPETTSKTFLEAHPGPSTQWEWVSFVVATFSLPAPAATAFHLTWPHAHTVAVIDAWQDWAPTAPDDLAAGLFLSASGDPEKPPAVNVFGAMLGTEADADELFDGLVALAGADPTSAFRKQMPYRETKRYLADLGDSMAGEDDRLGETSRDEPAEQGHTLGKSEFFRRPLPAEGIAALVQNFSKGRVPGQSRELDFAPWGGAYNRVRPDATAFAHREELFLLQHAVIVDPDASAAEGESARRWLGRSWGSVHGWGSGRVYPNFPDPELEDWARAYHGENLDRLVEIKARYDPDTFLRFHQSVPHRAPAEGYTDQVLAR